MINEFKACKTCLVQKPFDEFHKNPSMISGRTNECKICHHSRLKIARNDPLKKSQFKKYQRTSLLKRVYGISDEQYNEMIVLQDNKCLICHEEPKPNTGKAGSILNVDHCHTTGKVRGLLCHLCNRAIGLFRERIDLIEKALEYLKYHNDH